MTPFPPSKGNQPTTTCLPSGGHFFRSSWSSPTTNWGEPIPLWPSSPRPPSTADHGNKKFVRPKRFPLYDDTIANNATTVVQVCAEAAHKSPLNDFASYEAAKCGVAKFLCDVINKIWYNNLEDADLFYTKITAIDIMALLDANSRGLHDVDMIILRTNMIQYYMQAEGIPQYIVMMEDAQKSKMGKDAHCRCLTCDDGLSGGPRGPTFPVQSY